MNIDIITITKSFHKACGEPSLDCEKFKQAVYIGYGSSAIRVLLAGLDVNEENVKEMALLLGYNKHFKIVVKGE